MVAYSVLNCLGILAGLKIILQIINRKEMSNNFSEQKNTLLNYEILFKINFT